MEQEQADTTLGTSLIKTATKHGLGELAGETVEVLLDQLLDGTLQAIPVVSNVIKLVKAGIAVQDYMFMKKLLHFLLELEKISSDERSEWGRKLDHDPAFAKQVGDHLILLLIRLNDMDKPTLVARVFAAFNRNHISYIELTRLNEAIDRVNIADLEPFRQHNLVYPFEGQNDWHYRLSLAGLMQQKIVLRANLDSHVVGSPESMVVGYTRNILGQLLTAVCLKDDQEVSYWLEQRPRLTEQGI